jgi:hypothetical protein
VTERRTAAALADQYEHVRAVDLSPPMINIARQKRGNSRISFEQGALTEAARAPTPVSDSGPRSVDASENGWIESPPAGMIHLPSVSYRHLSSVELDLPSP